MNLWVNFSDIEVDQRTFVWLGDDSSSNDFFIINSRDSGAIEILAREGGSSGSDLIISGIDTNQLYMVTATRDGQNISIYINGTLKDSGSHASNDVNLGQTGFVTYIGQGRTGNPIPFEGTLDEVSFWNRTLNFSEIEELYNNGSGLAFGGEPTPPSLENATFENINVTDTGFFGKIGSSILRVVKGWFTDLDVSGTANLTGDTYLTNSSCSSGQVLTTDSNGLIFCTDVVDVKSGSASVTEGSCASITFNTAFSSTPVATGNVQDSAEDNVVSIGNLSTTGFNLCLEQVGGAGSHTVYWIATNAGNP